MSSDPITKISQIAHYDPVDDALILEDQQDCTDIVENAKARYNLFDERSRWKGDLHKVAEIPMTIFMELQRKGILDDQRAMKRWLNDADNRVFRTRPGRV